MTKARVLALCLIATGCRTAVPEGLEGTSTPDDLDRRIAERCAAEPDPEACRSRTASSYCEAQGGDWVQFSNGCRDLCGPANAQAAGKNVICTMDVPFGCECGDDRCWNGTACEPMAAPGEPGPRVDAPDCPAMHGHTPLELARRAGQRERCLGRWFGQTVGALRWEQGDAADRLRACIRPPMASLERAAPLLAEAQSGLSPATTATSADGRLALEIIGEAANILELAAEAAKQCVASSM